MSEIHTWDKTAANNNAASPNGWPENMAYSAVNNSARENMAAIARYLGDINGTLATTGSANAYVLTPNRTISAYADGLDFVFKANFANTGAATLNVSALGAKDLRDAAGAALPASYIELDKYYQVRYQGTYFIVSAAYTSEAAVAAIYDAFDDRYLGSKAADPSLDNDGDALVEGALYWNSTIKRLKVYNGSAWQLATAASDDVTYDNTVSGLSATTVKGAIDLLAQPHKNIVLNGDFQVWPEGTSFTGVANADHSAAQWGWAQIGTGVVDVAQITTALPTVAESGRLITSAIQVDVTTADATLAASDRYALRTRIEGYDYAQIARRPMVLSFWHKHTKTGTYCVSVRNADNDRSYVAEYTQSVSDTWERAEIPITASPSAGTWDYTTGIGLRLDFTIAAGTTFQTTAGAWQTGDYRSTSSQVNGMDAATNFFRIAGVQLEAGSVATEFEQDRYEDVLAATKRYYQLLPGTGINGYASNSTAVRVGFLYEAEMRVAPTVTLVDTTPTLLYRGATQDGVSSTIANSTINTQGARLVINGFTGLTAGEGTIFNQHNDLFELDARL